MPRNFQADESTIRELLVAHGLAELITSTAEGLVATPVPLAFEPDADTAGRLLGHIARSNPQWRTPVLGDALVIIREPDC